MAQSQQTYSTLTFCIFQWIKTLVEKTKNWPFMQGDIQPNYTTYQKKVKGKKNPQKICHLRLSLWKRITISLGHMRH